MRKVLVSLARIAPSIHFLRGQKVMLGQDLAELYGVTASALLAVRRNRARFPKDFLLQLTAKELANLKSQFAISSWGGLRSRPYAFTEQGVAMLSSVLKSERAVKVNIAIMRALSGEHTRLACWRWRPRHRELVFSPANCIHNIGSKRCFSARRRKEHARRVRFPEFKGR